MVKIGIDARCLTEKPSGVTYHCLNIIEQLIENKIEIVLFNLPQSTLKNSVIQQLKKLDNPPSNRINRIIWQLFKLPRLFKNQNIDLIWGPAHYLSPRLPKRIAKVVTIHDLVWVNFPETMERRNLFSHQITIPVTLRQADLIITSSLSTQQDLEINYPYTMEKTTMIYCGSRGGKLGHTIKQTEISKKYILCTGTIEPRKNHLRLLTAYSRLPNSLREKHPLIIAGKNGWGDINLKELINELGICHQVRLTGYINDLELAELYEQAYCLVMPSLYEGFGLPILEAQRFGVPVITSNTSSMPEIAGEGALLVDPKSITSIQNGLQELLESRELWEKLSEKSLINVNRFSWEKAGIETLKAFRNCIDKKRVRK